MAGEIEELWQRVHSGAGLRMDWRLKSESVPWPELQPAAISRIASNDQFLRVVKALPHNQHR
jgi:hypothetical protein